MFKTKIIGLGFSVPDKILSNKDIENMVDTNDQWIVKRTGIKERRIAPPDKATSFYAVEASKQAIKDSGIDKEEIDLIICATSTPDMIFPSTACLVQNQLGITNCGGFDLQAACSGFTYGLSVGDQMLKSGRYRYILIIGADLMTRITDFTDRGTCILFGDGAGATIIGRSNDDSGIMDCLLNADGSYGGLLFIPAGGSLSPATEETIKNHEHYMRMNGREVFKKSVEFMSAHIKKLLKKNNLSKDDIRWYIGHQANKRILEAIADTVGVERERVPSNIQKYGNTSAATIPILLTEMVRENKIKNGDLIILTAFGAGFSWGSVLIKW